VDQLPTLSIDNNPIVAPLVILDFQTQVIDGKPTRFALVQWEGLLADDTSWEVWDELKATYNLEDKVGFQGGSDVMDQPSANGPNDSTREARPKRIIKLPKRLEDCVMQ
jgi:hypothetical protein